MSDRAAKQPQDSGAHLLGRVMAIPGYVLARGCNDILRPGMNAVRALTAPVIGPREAPALGEEAVPEGEQAAIARVVELSRQTFERDYTSRRPALRDQHAKAHGCLRAEFVVAPGVPQDLRHGIFAEPRSYPAWVRFSPSSPTPQSDAKRDAHGMSIKVMGVAGEKVLPAERDETTQDFVVANSAAFFCRNAADYVGLAAKLTDGRLLSFFLGMNPMKWHLLELVNLVSATQKKVVNPLQIRYWSQTPYALGPHAVKYSARPDGPTDRRPVSSSPDQLEQAIDQQLANGAASFDFMVQLQTDPRRMPVEDAAVEWSERASPFRTVATIRIAPQDFTSAKRREFAEHLSFTPWHSLPDHRPLGGINRVRRVVYDTISARRHEMNAIARHEPDEREQA